MSDVEEKKRPDQYCPRLEEDVEMVEIRINLGNKIRPCCSYLNENISPPVCLIDQDSDDSESSPSCLLC